MQQSPEHQENGCIKSFLTFSITLLLVYAVSMGGGVRVDTAKNDPEGEG